MRTRRRCPLATLFLLGGLCSSHLIFSYSDPPGRDDNPERSESRDVLFDGPPSSEALAQDTDEDTNRVEVSAAPGLYPSGDFTVGVWIYLDDPYQADRVLCMWDREYFSYQMWITSDLEGIPWPAFQWGREKGPDTAVLGQTEILQDSWYHLVGVHRGTALEIHVNGVLDGEMEGAAGATRTARDALVIGAVYAGGGALGGRVDEVRVSDVARSTCWIQAEHLNISTPRKHITIGDERIVSPAIS